ncbi:hypothetical protein A2U01_0019394, partial [Trifolium medium]|nr:hypothetical protein [Trifolium medium]
RGVDLISSSLTWNSLLSFFSAKGLSTGKHDHDAVLVTGKVVNKECGKLTLNIYVNSYNLQEI